jgi:hypothetical protein
VRLALEVAHRDDRENRVEQEHDNCDLENVGDGEEEGSDGYFEAFVSPNQS